MSLLFVWVLRMYDNRKRNAVHEKYFARAHSSNAYQRHSILSEFIVDVGHFVLHPTNRWNCESIYKI